MSWKVILCEKSADWCLIARDTPVPTFLHTPPPLPQEGSLCHQSLIKVKVSSNCWLFKALNAAATVPGVVGWIQLPHFLSLPRTQTLYPVTLQFLLLEAKYPSWPLNTGLGQGRCLAQWDVIRYDANRSLNWAWPVGLPSFLWEERFQESHWSKDEERLIEQKQNQPTAWSGAQPSPARISHPAANWQLSEQNSTSIHCTEFCSYLLYIILCGDRLLYRSILSKFRMLAVLSVTFLLKIRHLKHIDNWETQLIASAYQSFAMAWNHFQLKMHKPCGKRKMFTCIFQLSGKKS